MERWKFTREFSLTLCDYQGSRRFVCAGRASPWYASVAAAQLMKVFADDPQRAFPGAESDKA